MKDINIVTLGCSKNTVDSEVLAGQLAPEGYKIYFDSPEESEIVIINTCGFINDAKEESIETILRFAEARKNGKLQHLVVMGCLSQRYKTELADEIPEVDRWYGVEQIESIVSDFEIQWRKELLVERTLSTPPHYAYVKIAEGCDRKCSFCAIPMIRGKHISKTMDDISAECKNLVKNGVKELLLISQDLTYYGKDIYGENMLALLVDRIAKENPETWIRLHYTFPLGFSDELIEVFRSNHNVMNYIDIPLQHISSRILKSMRRGIDKEGTEALIERFRNLLPDAAIRTAFIVGYPGETEEDFAELQSFIEKYRFERMGVFTYSHEENTHAAEMEDNIPEETKNLRRDILMDIQQKISLEHNKSLVGRKMKVIIDRLEGEYWIGRTEYDSPEVDNEVLIKMEDSEPLEGKFIDVMIKEADDYDLYATRI
ncbi:MAG: 30S ribosomal protein S12 methylthiotransferase RimO [Marinilabiliales bacterium]|nr:MAG: 30S ribosomal protein S12 methylthiotransferase RimO [Marinilabiliales bacterium]